MDRTARLSQLRRHLKLIDDGVAPVVEAYRQHVHCGPGCGDCCHQTFGVSSLEGQWLREGLKTLSIEQRAAIIERANAYQPDERMPCPLLGTDASCQLYPWRPRLCRKYGIPLWHPDRPHEVRTCKLNFRDLVDIDADMILEPQAEWARDWIRLREATGLRHDDAASIADHLRTGNDDA